MRGFPELASYGDCLRLKLLASDDIDRAEHAGDGIHAALAVLCDFRIGAVSAAAGNH